MSNEAPIPDQGSEKKTLLLALIAGMCRNALLSALTVGEVAVSV